MFKTAVLICTHNGEDFIEEQINSILVQTVKVDEIHVHDYHSTDDTANVVRKLIGTHSNIFLSEFNFAKGPAYSFLNSIKKLKFNLKGDYIIHITDQDDVWEKLKNETILESFTRLKINATFHDVTITNEKLETIKNSYYGGYYDATRDLSIVIQTYSNCVIGHTISINLETLKTLDLEWDNRIPMHDWYLINQMLVNKSRIHFIPKALSKYRQHNKNILGAQRIKNLNIFKYIRNQGRLLREYVKFQKNKGMLPNGNMYYNILRNIKPLKKKIYLLTALFLSK